MGRLPARTGETGDRVLADRIRTPRRRPDGHVRTAAASGSRAVTPGPPRAAVRPDRRDPGLRPGGRARGDPAGGTPTGRRGAALRPRPPRPAGTARRDRVVRAARVLALPGEPVRSGPAMRGVGCGGGAGVRRPGAPRRRLPG